MMESTESTVGVSDHLFLEVGSVQTYPRLANKASHFPLLFRSEGRPWSFWLTARPSL
ncbi:hypothetical protein KP509_21G020900 [Ceratopteris richardii]|uniref:Uncharacterized protein n=1 Tax=Ceratopteris richardii TaxID=49495 RepID=A0A8T2S820_CERRI|nr:hypothetical protein KP509_21G020900 [Ceratopteris richardii]